MRVQFTMLISSDLGPISRAIPIARALSRRGHEVVFSNPAAIPAKIIAEAGFDNLPFKPSVSPRIWPDFSPRIWHVNHGMTTEGFLDSEYIRGVVRDHMTQMESVQPDVVVDIWNMRACIAAQALGIPLVSVMQADLHPQGSGLIWWEEPPDDLPDPLPATNPVLLEFGLEPARESLAERWTGNLTLIVGTPDTDPLPPGADVHYLGPLQLTDANAELPQWVKDLFVERPLIWVYPGNPNYGGGHPTPFDSLVVIESTVAALADLPAQVIMTTGHQTLPGEFRSLPGNFHVVDYLPGQALADHVDLFIHHGGHGSYLTGLAAGTPALVIPTFSERESNARRLAQLGAGEFILPSERENWEKHVAVDELRQTALRILANSTYRENAQRIARSMKAYGGAELAAELIERVGKGPGCF